MINLKYILVLLTMVFWSCNQDVPSDQQMPEQQAQEYNSVEGLIAQKKIQTGPILQREMSSEIHCTGRIIIPSPGMESVHSKVEGQVRNLKLMEGDYVKKGTRLVSIESPDLLNKQRLLMEMSARLHEAELDYERKLALQDNQAVSARVFEETESRYKQLKSGFDGLSSELALIGVQIDPLIHENKYQSSVSIYARQSGYVHDVLVKAGQNVNPGDAIMELVNMDKAMLELQVLSKDAAAVQVGQSVTFTLANQNDEWSATVEKINPLVNEETSTLQVWCTPNKEIKADWVGGIFVQANIKSEATQATGLPIQAVLKNGDDYYGFKKSNGVWEKVILANAHTLDDFVIFDGPKDGEWVLDGAYYVE